VHYSAYQLTPNNSSTSDVRSFNAWQVALLLVALTLVSGLITSTGFLQQETLYWDTGRIFTQFRDQLHSLNFFGKIAWWFPHHQLGSPGYFHSILGVPSCINPIFALFGFACWVLGHLGIFITRFQPIFVFYFAFVIPFFFLLGVHLVAKQLFKHKSVQLYILILAAFSPGVLFSISDVGYLEPTCYALYFVAAYLKFLRKPIPRQFWTVTFTLMLVALSFNHAALYFNLIAIPLFILCSVLFSGKQLKQKLRTLFSVVPKWQTIFAVLLVIGSWLPNALTLQQGEDLVRTSLEDGQIYPYDRLAAGNPLEILSVSLPGFGYDWNSDRQKWTLKPFSTQYHTAYYYLGLLALPLFFCGLLFARIKLRLTLFVFLLVFGGVVCLSAYSPIFGSILAFETPLRSAFPAFA